MKGTKRLSEIKKRYNVFADALIESVEYQLVSAPRLTVTMSCLNWSTDNWERISLCMSRVTNLRLVETKKAQISVVFEALIEQRENDIVIDFFARQIDGFGVLEEDPHSSFSVHCQELSVEIKQTPAVASMSGRGEKSAHVPINKKA